MVKHRFAYPDTCFLLPLFFEESGSAVVRRRASEFTQGGRLSLIISELTRLEFNSAVSKQTRMGKITKAEAWSAIADFERQCDREFFVLPVQSEYFASARKYIAGLNTSLRTADALHLAIAHTNGCTLLTADKQLSAAASLLGVDHCFVSYS